MSKRETPTFNLKAVVQETGLKPDTLRAWERRYGLPAPQRTSGGHRLYSERDIQLLKWLLQRQEEGLSISRAVDMWRKMEAEQQDPLRAMPLDEAATTAPSSFVAVEAGETMAELRQSWIDACLAFDEQRAELVLGQAFSFYTPEVVCTTLLQQGLAEIGAGWYSGKVSVQQEHFASALALRRLDTLLTALPAPLRNSRIVIGCPPGENHTFGPLLLTFLLRRRGWHVVYLGANVPTNRLHAALATTRPALVVFAAQLLETAASLLDTVLYLQENDESVVAYGGQIFNRLPALQGRIPGHFLGTELSQAPLVIEHLINAQPPPPTAEPPDAQHTQTLDYFRERAGLMQSYLWQRLDEFNVPKSELSSANDYLTHRIIAALRLGDLNYISADLNWVEGLIINHNIPAARLDRYLALYHQAAKDALPGAAGQLVLQWLAKIAEQSRN